MLDDSMNLRPLVAMAMLRIKLIMSTRLIMIPASVVDVPNAVPHASSQSAHITMLINKVIIYI